MSLYEIVIGGLYTVNNQGSDLALAIDVAGVHAESHLISFYDPTANACAGGLIPVKQHSLKQGTRIAVVHAKHLLEHFPCIPNLIAANGIYLLHKVCHIDDDQFASYADHLVDIMKTDRIDSVKSLRLFIAHEMELLCKIRRHLSSQEGST